MLELVGNVNELVESKPEYKNHLSIEDEEVSKSFVLYNLMDKYEALDFTGKLAASLLLINTTILSYNKLNFYILWRFPN